MLNKMPHSKTNKSSSMDTNNTERWDPKGSWVLQTHVLLMWEGYGILKHLGTKAKD